MKISQTDKLLAFLTGLFAVLSSLPFLIPHTGFISLFSFVPLLMMERIASLSGTKRIWLWHYTAFVLWNAFTTFWVCNATVGGGLFAIFANAFQMSVIFGIFRFSKRYFSGALPYIFLAVMWIAWERAYFDAEISWPWLVLGNAFAGSIKSVQWYEFTGTLGGSLWIWTANLSIFGLFTALSDGSWFRFNIKAKSAAVSFTVLLLTVPFAVSHIIYSGYVERTDPIDVIIVQPNIDPYNKFSAMTRQEQNALYISMARRAMQNTAADSSLSLMLAPETFTNDVIVNYPEAGRTVKAFSGFASEYPGLNILFGASSYEYLDSDTRPSHTARQVGDGRWVESHNSAIVTDGTGRTEIFHKNKLVVAVEKTPYPAVFCRIDDMLGGVMGRCIGQDSVSVLHLRAADGSMTPVGCAVCYESVYGEYYTEYVRKGAEVMTIITNDAWWGNTPGYRQHLRYASLRAVETRRSIARCANTGISAFIDQRGEAVMRSSWWKPEILEGTINKNDSVTFFVRYGDMTGRICTFLFLLLLAAMVVRMLTGRRISLE